MTLRKVTFVVCFLGLLALSNQFAYRSDNDSDITITHPSVFHDEYIDTKSTIQGSSEDKLIGRPPKSLNLERGRPVFGDTSDSDTSSSDTSDLTDASESSESDAKQDVFGKVADKAKDLEERAYRKFDKQKRMANIQARKYWQAMKFKIMREAKAANATAEEFKDLLKSGRKDAKQAWKDGGKKYWQAMRSKIMQEAETVNASAEELKALLSLGKKDAKQAWKDLKWKIKNGNDILDDLMDSTNDFNPNNTYKKRGSTEPVVENNTARPSNTIV